MVVAPVELALLLVVVMLGPNTVTTVSPLQ